MRVIYLAVFVASIALTHGANTRLQRKDLLDGLLGGDLLGGVVDGVVDSVVDGLVDEGGLLGGLLGGDVLDNLVGPSGLISSVLGNLLGPDVVGSLLSDVGIKSILGSVNNLVSAVVGVVDELLMAVLAVLEGVDLSNTSEVIKKFDAIPCNKLCPVCALLKPDELQPTCTSYCKATCRWVF